jgi:GT2 family glycosyltransferase
MSDLTLSVVIATYRRESVLVDTIGYLLDIAHKTPGFLELLVIDQTPRHEAEIESRLSEWHQKGAIQWVRLEKPDLVRAMNLGLLRSRGMIVLFLDDDILPDPELLKRHLEVYGERPGAWAVVGQILQPGEKPEEIPFTPHGGPLSRYLDFPFWRNAGLYIEHAMAGNLSVRRERALAIGGFDENFTPPVAYRFETEFAKRLVDFGGKIWFEPGASIRHLRASSGGTRSLGGHLTSISPRHGVGDYYYALRRGQGGERLGYIATRPFREVGTRFHLRHPWWIPVKFIGEILAIFQAVFLFCRGPRFTGNKDRNEG